MARKSKGDNRKGHRKGRKRGVRPRHAGDWQPAFLKALGLSPVVLAACDAAGVSRKTAYQERSVNDVFRAAWDEAMEDALDRLEAIVFARAKTHMDLARWLLARRRRNLYGDRLELSGEVVQRVITEEIVDASPGPADDPPPSSPGGLP